MKRALPIAAGLTLVVATGCSLTVSPIVDRLVADAGPGGTSDAPEIDVPGSTGCTMGLLDCGGRCVDPTSDPTACGGCGNACAPGAACVAGTCNCPAGTTDCGAGCTTGLMTDPLNCGSCGNSCGPGGTCVSGACACAAGLVDCAGACADLATDPEHCGACGNICLGGACAASTCECALPLVDSGGICVDVTRDPENCGEVGFACGSAEYCASSVCVCRPPTVPGPTGCVDPATSPDACGSAAATCRGTTPVCSAGACIDACPGGTTECSNACVDLDADSQNCGACGDNCSVDQVCSSGSCQDFYTAAGCTSCPCAACVGDFARCCVYPGTSDTICVDGDCP